MSNGLILTHCGLVRPHCDIAAVGQHWLDNGLPPDGTEPLLEPMMIYCQLDTFYLGRNCIVHLIKYTCISKCYLQHGNTLFRPECIKFNLKLERDFLTLSVSKWMF